MKVAVYSSIAFLLVLAANFCLAQEKELGCVLADGRRLKHEEHISDDPCETCMCYKGSYMCGYYHCEDQYTPCVDRIHRPGECCSECPNGANCFLPDGSVLSSRDSPLTMADGQVCSCTGSHLARCYRK